MASTLERRGWRVGGGRRREEGGNLDKNENWICAMARYHAESNNISLTRNLPTDSRVRQ